MFYAVWYALGIFTGLIITSRHFRVIVLRKLKLFGAWIKYVIERKKKIAELEKEICKLKGNGFTIKHLD
jgi:hypothetical protein